jgi:glycosyltransferase 2 family protein
MKRWQSLLLGIAISAITLIIALRGNDIGVLMGEFARGRYLYVVPVVLVVIFSLAVRGERWRALLLDRLSSAHAIHITNISYFLGALLPFRIGEVVRAYLTTRLDPPISMFTSFSSIVVERLFDLLTVAIIVLIAVVIMQDVPAEIVAGTQATAIIAVVGMAFLTVLSVRRGIAHKLLELALRVLPFLKRFGLVSVVDRILDGLAPLSSLRALVRVLGLNALAWFGSVFAAYIGLFVFYENPNWQAALLSVAMASIAIALPAAPSGVGTFQFAVIFALQVTGLIGAGNPPERATAYAVLIHAINVLCYVGTGLVGIGQERVSLGEVIQSARVMGTGKKAEEAPASN